MMRPITIPIGLLLMVSCAAGAGAQKPPPRTPPAPAEPWPSLDIIDLWHRFRPKAVSPNQTPASGPRDASRHFVVLAPAIGSRPSTALTLGVNGNMAFFEGDPRSTHISQMAGGSRVWQKLQVL